MADTLAEVPVASLQGFMAGLAAVDSGLWDMRSTDPSRRGGRNVGGRSHHSYSGYYGYYGPFDYGLDDYNDYTGPYYDDSDSFDVQPAASYAAPDEPTSLIMSVQKELSRLGYYHGPIDGIAGSQTEQALRWFQSVDHLPLTGQIDSATLQALRIA